MNLTIQSTDTAEAAAQAARIASMRTPLPALRCVHIKADKRKNTVTFSATDMEQRVSITCPAEVEEGGEICVNAGLFSQLIGSASGAASLELDKSSKSEDSRLVIKTDQFTTRLAVIGADEFPPLEDAGKYHLLKLPAAIFAERLCAVKYAAHTDQGANYLFCSVVLVSRAGKLEVFSTDRHRAALAPLNAAGLEQDTVVVIPSGAVATILRIIESCEEIDLRIHGELTDPAALSITLDNGTHYTCKLIAGTYPNYRQVMPPDEVLVNSIHVQTAELKNALQRCMPFASADIVSNGVTIEPAGTKLQISATGQEIGSISLAIPCTVTGNYMPVKFNAAFFLNIIAADGPETTVIRQADDLGQQQITGKSATHIIMPIRVK